ncbi:MAG: hypothetical protein NXH75_09700, partial [Halobacteriovoraceae bacterium]|nr:hypothetical protein [Halobacteriovoraceae bacterium]
MNSIYESGYLQYLLILNLLTLVFIIKNYGKGLSRNGLLKKLSKYLLFFFVFHIVDTLFIASTMRLKHDHFYNRVDYTTPIEKDYLKFKENLHFGYCNIRMGILSNLSCRPYYLFRHLKRSTKFKSPKDFNKQTKRQDSQNRTIKYLQWTDETIKKCLKKQNFLENDCIEANLLQRGRNPKKGKEIIREVVKVLGPKLEEMKCLDFFKATIEYKLYNYDLNKILILNNVGGTNKEQWIKNLTIKKCFLDKCQRICSEQYRFYWGTTKKERVQKIIFLTLFLEENPLHKDQAKYYARLHEVFQKLRIESHIENFDAFFTLLKEYYPKYLLK